MNNYIPINKAVNPVCIYQGYEPLINKTLGVDEMIYGFDGTPSDYATCTGAPEMFIKVERDGLYYFGVEADDTGSLTIAGEQAIKKDGTPPNGKLNIETDSRYLKAGYYKVACRGPTTPTPPSASMPLHSTLPWIPNLLRKGSMKATRR